MKKFILCIFIIMPFQLKSQNLFDEFLKHFYSETLPYSIGDKSQRLDDNYVLKYICDGDSSCLEYEFEGINMDTGKIMYVKKKKYEYNAYIKLYHNKFVLLVYSGYLKCEEPDFTGRTMIGLFSKNGDKMDEMEFYVVNNESLENLTDKRGTILEDESIEITVLNYERENGKPKCIPVKERYVVNEDLSKFELISRDTVR